MIIQTDKNGKLLKSEIAIALQKHLTKRKKEINDCTDGSCTLSTKKKDGQIVEGRAPWMKIAYNELGVEETAGSKHNPKVLEYHKSAGLVDYKNSKGQNVKINDDENWPWCSSFVSWVFSKTKDYSGKLTAKATNWKNWGKADSKDNPIYGSLAVIDWGANDNGAGHVGFVVSVDGDTVYLLGGNQTGGDKTTNEKVCIGSYKKSQIDCFRVPKDYNIKKEIDFKYDEIKKKANGFENINTTR